MLHETTRRRLCRAAFVASCIVPTFFVLGFVVSQRLPGQAEAAARTLGQRLGLAAWVEDVSHPRPGAVLHQAVELKDSETGQTLLKSRNVETWARGGSLVLSASQVELPAATLGELWRGADRLLRETHDDEPTQISFVAGDVTWRGPRGDLTFTGLEGRLGPTGPQGADRELTLRFRLAGTVSLEPITIRVVRHRGAQPPTTSVMLRTGELALPAALLAPWLDADGCFGSRATFRGYFALDLEPAGWQGELSGEVTNLDLATLFAGRVPHVCTGAATLTLDRAKIHQGRIVEAAGTLVAGPGTMGRSLVLSAGESLRLLTETPPTLERIERYEQLACGFVLNERGLAITGRCKNAQAGAMLVVRGMDSQPVVVWRQPPGEPQSCVALVRAISPASNVDVPATRETEWLIRHLPMRASVAADSAQDSSLKPEARLNLVPPRAAR